MTIMTVNRSNRLPISFCKVFGVPDFLISATAIIATTAEITYFWSNPSFRTQANEIYIFNSSI